MAKADKEVVLFQAHRSITVLCKSFLNILEDLQEEYDRYFEREKFEPVLGIEKLPEKFLDDNHFSYLRKKVLDKGGEVTRELQNEIIKYNLEIIKNGNKEEGDR